MGMEEDTYSSIFQALKHPIRRRILRMLNDNPMTYTEILNELGIDNGLLNYHLENLQELLAKGEDEKYRLSEFGSAGLSVIERVETPKENSLNKQLLKLNNIQSIIVILLLVTSTLLNGYFYRDNLSLRKEIQYSKLFDSNYTTPISKVEAVSKALVSDGWTSSRLRGMEISTSLIYIRHWVSNNGKEYGWDYLGNVNHSVSDYSPRFEYNTTNPGGHSGALGTMTYRYVWAITVQKSLGEFSIPPPGLYYVDVCTGELFKGDALGFC
ncbi:helix-turn-helix domain-containing protein [Candidatus Bathyarchaeota archaeon]|nr:helix-turn-helix domain-containing protein [Candidatus Bathyarchaeota archaeon]